MCSGFGSHFANRPWNIWCHVFISSLWIHCGHFQLKLVNMSQAVPQDLCCEICGENFKSERSFTVHLKNLHTQRRIWECDRCDSKFDRKFTFENHYRAVHLKLKPFECSFCEQMFATYDQCQLHEKRHLRNDLLPCPMCGKEFVTGTELKRHINTHTRERSFTCFYCSTTLTQAGHRRRHMRTVHGIE